MRYRHMLCLLILLLPGCAGNGIFRQNAAGSVVFEIHGRSYDAAWNAMTKVTDSLLTIVDSDKSDGTIKARRGVVMGPWGDIVDFSLQPVHDDPSAYTIEVRSLDHPEIQLARQDWVTTIIYRIKAELAQLPP